ncbi:MAG: 3D domain-containing protein [Clostridiales bacterium]|nr:3D domain-containing protein [Clostridiales bacterium]
MTKATGVWLRPTELGEVAIATVMAQGSSSAAAPISGRPASSREKGSRPVLIAALGVCCCLLAGLIGLFIFSDEYSLPLPGLSVTALAGQISGGDPEQSHFVRISSVKGVVNTAAEILPAAEDFSLLPEDVSPSFDISVNEEGVTSETAMPAAPLRALEDQPVLASRSGDSADTGEITVGEEILIYTRRLFMESTAYTWTGNRTATGTWPAVGTIAVDPGVIPLGSRVYVDGYGLAIAADTGGLIKGNIIDVYFDTRDECMIWGRKRGIAVYILE